MNQKTHRWDSKVRDYELDAQGIVNNANYVNYFEQCRNDYGRALGIDFYEYHKAGYDLVVAGIEIQYRAPLRSQDEFYVTAKISQITDKRVIFEQEIKSTKSDRLVAKALVTTACIDHKTGRSCMPASLIEKLPIQQDIEC